MEALKLIATAASYLITLCTLFGIACKPVRNFFLQKFSHETQTKELIESIAELKADIKVVNEKLDQYNNKQAALEEAEKCNLRNTITHLYYKYKPLGAIPPLEKENFERLCKAYFGLHGNSYVKDTCYEEIMTLPIC